MKQKKFRHHHDTDDDADDTLRSSAKIIGGDINTVDSSICTSNGSFDTTEDLTDTDTSSQNKSDSPRRRSSTALHQSHNTKNSSTGSNIDGNFGGRIQFVMKANKLKEVESHENFTSKERSNYWWSDREKDRMMAKHERLVAKYEQQRSATKPGTSKKSSFDKIGSYRGLESWTAAGSLKLDHTIEQCISAVMDEQDRQWNENDDDIDIIAKKSLAVTEDSTRRARLNGLQDAQEALKLRGESWSHKSGSDEISVGSAYSTGTAAIAKKKKRSKLLARLDDSHKVSKSSVGSDKEDVLASFKKNSSKEIKKDKKKKKQSSKKNQKNELGDENGMLPPSKIKKKKKEPKDKTAGMNRKSNSSLSKADLENSRTHVTSQPSSISSRIYELEKSRSDNLDIADDDVVFSEITAAPVTTPNSNGVSSFLAGPTTPMSPLSMQTGSDEYPLLTTLRRQQEQLRRSSIGIKDDTKGSKYQHQQQTVIEDEDDCTEDISPLLQTLRRQQKKQALSWKNDPSDGGNSGTPTHSGGPVNKVSSFRADNSKAGDSVAPKFSDPPGRRPRRLASRHLGAYNEKNQEKTSASSKVSRSRSRSHDRMKKAGRSGISSKTPPTPAPPPRSRSRSHDRMKNAGRSGTSSYTPPTPPSPPAPDSSSILNSPSVSGKKSINLLRNGAKTFFKKGSKK